METDKYLNLITNKCSDKFTLFSSMMKEYNKVCNITSICDDKGILYKHFFDSAAGEFLFGEGANVVEIGSGGGFPSIPLKIVRDDLKFTLIESTGKKCAFLNSVVDKLKLDCVKVLNIRAEDGAHDKLLREKFDVISRTARKKSGKPDARCPFWAERSRTLFPTSFPKTAESAPS